MYIVRCNHSWREENVTFNFYLHTLIDPHMWRRHVRKWQNENIMKFFFSLRNIYICSSVCSLRTCCVWKKIIYSLDILYKRKKSARERRVNQNAKLYTHKLCYLKYCILYIGTHFPRVVLHNNLKNHLYFSIRVTQHIDEREWRKNIY